MVQFTALMAGLLLFVGSQASDVADSSAFQGFLSNYVPVGTQRAPTSLNGYVPDGLSEAEYKASVNAEKTKANKNKQRFPTGKDRTLNVADYLKNLEGKQTFKGDKVTGSGHTYAKQKFDSKEAFDKAAGRFGKFILPAVSNVKQDSMAFKEFQSSKIAAGEEEKSAQTCSPTTAACPLPCLPSVLDCSHL
jgi:hypothetical protein